MIKLKSIAEQCGVSINTVSRAINDKADINPKTKQRIMDYVEKVGFIPNYNARGMSSNKRFLLGYIFSLSFGTTNMRQLGEMIKYVQQKGYGTVCETLIDSSQKEFKTYCKLIDNLIRYNPEGIIIDGEIIAGEEARIAEYLDRKKIPLTIVNAMTPVEACNTVVSNPGDATRKAVDYLVGRDNKEMVYLGWTRASGAVLFKGFTDALKMNGLEVNVIDTFDMDDQERKVCLIEQKLDALFKEKGRLGVFANTFWLGAIAEKWALLNGKNIPNDIDIITLEGDLLNYALPHRLAYCKNDCSLIADKALEFIIEERKSGSKQTFEISWDVIPA